MSQDKKFDYRIKQDGDKWHAEITRRVSARKTSVSKRKKGFASEALASQWAQEQLVDFINNQQIANKRKAEKRTTRNELAQKVESEKEISAKKYEEKQQAYFEQLDEEEEEYYQE